MSGNAALDEFDKLYEDASYSAQTYFEAAKMSEFWGRGIVFLPALLGAVAALLVALGSPREWGSVGAIAGAVAATAAFLGSDRKAASLKESARKFTRLRHEVRLEKALSGDKTPAEIEAKIRELWSDYGQIVSSSEPASNRAFAKASERIKGGVLDHGEER